MTGELFFSLALSLSLFLVLLSNFRLLQEPRVRAPGL